MEAEAAGAGPRVWLLCESTSRRRTLPPLVTVGHRLLWLGWEGPLTSPKTGLFATLLGNVFPCLGVPSCPLPRPS